LLNYLNQLHQFFVGVTKQLKGLDLSEVTEAVAHVIAAVPNAELANVFQMFCAPIAQQLSAYASKEHGSLEEDIPSIIGKEDHTASELTEMTKHYETDTPRISCFLMH
jgi:transportin-3